MKSKELLLPGCYVYSEGKKNDPVLGEVMYDYAELAKCGQKQVFSVHFEMEFAKANVLRGFYIQDAPFEQSCMVRCISGAAEITLLDLREHSSTYLKHVAVELSGESGALLFFPSGVAYAMLSCADDTVLYFMADRGVAESLSLTINAVDPKLNCKWPRDVAMSAVERSAQRVDELKHNYW